MNIMNKIAAFPGKYIQGRGALKSLPELINLLGGKGMILASKTVIHRILPKFGNKDITDHTTIELFGGECSEQELERLAKVISKEKACVMIGMGGGKTIDAAKISADRANIPVIIIPTIASTDAPCSGCAVTYTPSGVFEKVYYQRSNPSVVLVDMDIIAASPVRFLVSGMGDALATWFEARACAETNSINECGGTSTLAGLNLARLCYDILMEHGLLAKTDNEIGKVTPALAAITEANILLSGIGFESGGLAAAHAIHNGLTALDETHAFYHGEKVAFGVLAGLHLNAAPINEMEEAYSFCETIGLPTTFADIGLKHADREKLMIAAQKAAEEGSSIHHEGIEITPEKVLKAMIKADEMGRKRRAGNTVYE
jgi:glycerol dehydrogenase